jgi:hypothetical protein
MDKITEKFEHHKNIESDINEHFDTLHRYAVECDSIIEMGVRKIISTWAFLMGNPKKMISIDFNHPSIFGGNLNEVYQITKENLIDYQFLLSNTLECEIDDCDLLFIDTWHDYQQLKSELYRHSEKVRKYIILHDTLSFGFTNERIYETYDDERLETNLPKGLNVAIDEFLFSNKKWYIHERFAHNNGLTILKRI